MKYLEKPKIEWLEPLDFAYVTTKMGYSEPENLLWLTKWNDFVTMNVSAECLL
ncbi:MAG: hypothetical protein ACD_22C00166G0011 [uncultured bacterium]|nr:MAG: hypothetical protein ACD_22C00166G0011 [uncultured bacterium]